MQKKKMQMVSAMNRSRIAASVVNCGRVSITSVMVEIMMHARMMVEKMFAHIDE